MPCNLAYIGFRVLQIYWHYQFLYTIENESMAAIFILSILINHSYFELNNHMCTTLILTARYSMT